MLKLKYIICVCVPHNTTDHLQTQSVLMFTCIANYDLKERKN